MEYLQNASPTTSFQDYQTTQAASADPDAPGPQPAHEDQTVQDDQTAQHDQTVQDDRTAQHDQTLQGDQATQNDQTEQDEQIARAVQADLDAQAARDAIAPQSGQDGNLPDLDDDDDAVMQQVLIQSRQTAQPQGSDPQATSSAGATQSIEQELQRELKLGIGYQTEVQTLQLKVSQQPLSSDEVARYRTVSKLASDNHARVAELCDRQVQESLAQTSRNTRAILGSIQPMNLPKPKGSIVKPPPSSKDTKGAGSTSAPGKQGNDAGPKKAPPPILGANRPPVVKTLPQGPPAAPPKGQGSGAKSLPIQGGAQAPASPKPTLQSHLIGKNVSPRGNPPPRVLPRSNNPSRQSSVAGGNTLQTWRRNCERKRKQNVQDLMDRTVRNTMNGTHQHNKNLVIISRDITPVEIVDGEIQPQVKSHLLPTHRRRIVDHAHQEGPGLGGTDIQGVAGQDPVGGRGLTVEEGTLLKRRKDQDPREERVNIDRPRIGRGGITPLHQKKRYPKAMRRSGINPELPNLFKQRQRNLNRGIRHHYHHRQLRQRRTHLGQQQYLLYNRHLHNQFNGKLPKRCQL